MNQETFPDLSKVPSEYHDLKEVYNKRATILSHRPYDCAIDILPGIFPLGVTCTLYLDQRTKL